MTDVRLRWIDGHVYQHEDVDNAHKMICLVFLAMFMHLKRLRWETCTIIHLLLI